MQRFKRSFLAVALAAFVAAVATAAAASSGPVTTTYHGTFSGPVVYSGCTSEPPAAIASGTWTVALHGQTDATVTVNIFTNGKHHVSFGGTFPQIAPSGGQTFAVAIPTLAGPLVVSLTGATFTYRIAPYDAFGITCDSVTYSGSL
jgi:hypothetical protein